MKTRSIILMILAAAMVGGGVFIAKRTQDRGEIVRIKWQDVKFEITETGYWDETMAVLYSVRDKGKAEHEPSIMGVTHRPLATLKFAVISNASNEIVALTEKANPDVVLVIYSAKEDRSWPSDDAISDDQLDSYLRSLKQSTGKNNLRLASPKQHEDIGRTSP